MKKVQRINESQLRAIVAESVKKVLNEINEEPEYIAIIRRTWNISDEGKERCIYLAHQYPQLFSLAYKYGVFSAESGHMYEDNGEDDFEYEVKEKGLDCPKGDWDAMSVFYLYQDIPSQDYCL